MQKQKKKHLFQHETLGKKDLFAQTPKEMETRAGKLIWLVIPSGRRTAAVRYSVLNLEISRLYLTAAGYCIQTVQTLVLFWDKDEYQNMLNCYVDLQLWSNSV